MKMLQIKIIDIFARKSDYRHQLEQLYNDMRSVLTGNLTPQSKRRKNKQKKEMVSNIYHDAAKYYDVFDGLREEIEEEIDRIRNENKRINKAEKCLKRLRKLCKAVLEYNSMCSPGIARQIEAEFDNLRKHMEKHL